MEDRLIDRHLNIKTLGLRDWPDPKTPYNRYEGTPYRALDSLFKEYEISEEDKIVDFGCGRGRVVFYIHKRFKANIIGVEAHDLTYQEALDNKRRYLEASRDKNIAIEFKHILAQDYEIQDDTNIFYFFNPFSIKVFRLVVASILGSFDRENRRIDLIFYYPFPEYRSYMEDKTPFKTYKIIRVKGAKEKKEEFIIYRIEKDLYKEAGNV